MKLLLTGRGGECVVGLISKEKYDYWSQRDNDELTYELSGNSQDDAGEFALGPAYDLENVVHVNGPILEQAFIVITDDEDNEISSTSLTEFLEKNEAVQIEYNDDPIPHITETNPYAFVWCCNEKGIFYSVDIPSANINPKMLRILIHSIEEEFDVVELKSYDGKEPELLGDTTGNGYYSCLIPDAE